DVAEWNFAHAGSYSSRGSGPGIGLWSGYTSTYDADVNSEEPNIIYSQSYYSWTIEKWVFDGDLGTLVSVERIAENTPEHFTLKQNYPNPFNPSTTIEFEIQRTEHVELSIYSVLGQRVATLVNERLSPGSYKATFDASGLTSGIFFYRLEAGSFKEVKKMILTK
ncbi:MAG TPA: T9SS type A sorting domain-containing protein, partial [bacterium]